MNKKFYIISTITLFLLSIIGIWILRGFRSENIYIYICSITTVIVLSFYFYNLKYNRIAAYGPLTIFLFFYLTYYIGGILVYYIREKIYFNYSGNINYVSLVYSMSILIMVIFSNIFMNYNKSTKKKNVKNNVNLKKSKIIIIFVLVIGWIGAYKLFNGFTTIPLFAADKDLARVNLNSSGFAWFLIQFLQINIIFCSYMIMKNRNKKWDVIYFLLIIFLSFIPLFLYVGRSLFLVPLITIILMIVNFNKIPNWILVMLVGGVLLISMGTIYFRLTNTGEFDYITFQHIMLQDLFPEVRMFAISTEVMQPIYFENVFTTNIISIIPSGILNLLGVVKLDRIFIGSIILNNIATIINAGDILGIRISLIGETYFGGGILAIVIMSLAISILMSFLEICFKRSSDLNKLLLIILSILIACFVPYGYSFFVSLVQMFFIMYLIKVLVK